MSDKTDFIKALKSTVDKLAAGLAVALDIQYADIDDNPNGGELFRSESKAILVEFNVLSENPVDPLYVGSFNIGARTVNDPGNYDNLSLVGIVSDLFPQNSRIEIMDYSEVLAPSAVKGILNPERVVINPQFSDMSTGIRMATVHFLAQRFT